ncbi:hypothetical protein BDW42DRAFT_189850 [Aspergillus taichungensis]|uniref:DUF4238 domain-containing protein n=1 Tax=Aspergillus taichungensis TaxID=482145 RepID=A0A2J5IA58_9EURO|nr:hypothetical protein BDW42DRAFT_189850 [Aspergillus taichungensis]
MSAPKHHHFIPRFILRKFAADEQPQAGPSRSKSRRRRFETSWSIRYVPRPNEDDRHLMVEYMQNRGFSRPRDVWFANLRGLLELDMDAGGQWRRTIFDHVYPDDAMIFVAHVQAFFLTFCEPESPQLEFLLTENAYGVFEGPSDCGFDARTGKLVPGLYTEWHMFAPVAPRLLIILRSNMLSSGNLETLADDPPVRRCANSYSAQGVPDATKWTPCADHRFYFECFRLSRKHVDLINTLFLEESRARPGFKTVIDHPLDQRRLHILSLEKIAQDLGMNEKGKYTLLKPSPHATLMDFLEDLKQAGLLLLLRIKIGRILGFSRLSLSQKNCVRWNRKNFLVGMAPWRVWLYLKVSRNLPKYSPSDYRIQLAPLEVEGVEDGFVELLARYPERSEDIVRGMILSAMT